MDELDRAASSLDAAKPQPPTNIKEHEVGALNKVAHVFRNEIPFKRGLLALSSERRVKAGCTGEGDDLGSEGHESAERSVHPGEWRCPGLAHRIVGRLGFAAESGGCAQRSQRKRLARDRRGVVDTLIASVEKYARKPWLRPVHRCFTGLDDGGIM
jgi:hypothetical protein